MFNVNRVTLLGIVTRDAGRQTTSTGTFTEFGLATETTRIVKGVREAEAEFHRVVCFEPLAEFAAKLKKGTPLYIEGRIHTNHSTGKDAQFFEVIAEKLVILSKNGCKT